MNLNNFNLFSSILEFNYSIRSIPAEQLDKINAELEKDIMIRAIHDVKGIDMGSSLVRYKVMKWHFFK